MFGMFVQEDCLESEDMTEYRMLDKRVLRRKRQAYEEAEREDREDGKYQSGDISGECEDIV